MKTIKDTVTDVPDKFKSVELLENEIGNFEQAYKDWNNKKLPQEVCEKAGHKVHSLIDKDLDAWTLQLILKQTNEIINFIEKMKNHYYHDIQHFKDELIKKLRGEK